MNEQKVLMDVQIFPLVSERWDAFESLMGVNGGDEGCWCMWWRLSEEQFEQQKGDSNKEALKQLAYQGKVPGLLAYINGEVAAWCSIGPRANYPALHRYWSLNHSEDNKTWSIVCFFVNEKYRRKGLMMSLIEEAMSYAKQHGAKFIEGYPVQPKEQLTGYEGFTGLLPIFERLGYTQVDQNERGQYLMRYRFGFI